MKFSSVFLVLVMLCSIAKGQFMLGKGLDDIVNKYQNNKNFRLSVLRTPKGTVIPKFKINSTVQMKDTGDSENSIIAYKDLKTNELYTFFLENDKCMTFQHTYSINLLRKTKSRFEKTYKRIAADGIATDEWESLDGLYKISLIPYESLRIFDLQYHLN